ncbi:hypothetical protein FQA39_LY07669 [Lamprigera yunnana]|nr:hypothetical protein FQA39_LY07669 [Lamprigera yunnana]
MADKVAAENPDKKYDPTLDFYSDKFNPLKALVTPGVTPPIVNAKTHDNLSKYEQAYKDPKRQEVINAGSSKTQELVEVPERRWLPHQLPVRSERTRKVRNVLTRMESIKGPLQLLKKCKDDHIQIKIWTRHSHGIRGYCTGYVIMFDKHWNLVLDDVNEIWIRPKHRKIPVDLGDTEKIKLSKSHMHPPKIKIIKSDKKTDTCKRHIDQVLIRGEQIAFITILPCTQTVL